MGDYGLTCQSRTFNVYNINENQCTETIILHHIDGSFCTTIRDKKAIGDVMLQHPEMALSCQQVAIIDQCAADGSSRQKPRYRLVSTWHRSTDAIACEKTPGSCYGAVEPVAVERADGSILAFIRTQVGVVWQAISTDRDETFRYYI